MSKRVPKAEFDFKNIKLAKKIMFAFVVVS
jgi:hypothetical protein